MLRFTLNTVSEDVSTSSNGSIASAYMGSFSTYRSCKNALFRSACLRVRLCWVDIETSSLTASLDAVNAAMSFSS